MKKKVIITTVVAFVLLAAVIAAGLNAIFTVTHVRADFTTYSEAGSADAVELRGRLDQYIGKSSTFLDLGELSEEVARYPFFRLACIEKRYPTTVYLRIEERKETYAIAGEDGYTTFADNGLLLRSGLSENTNRCGGQNILLEGFSFTAEGSPATMQGEYAEALLSVMQAFKSALTEPRANVLTVTLMRNTSDRRNDFFRIRMCEGVAIDLADPASYPAEKAALALEKYFALSDEMRTFGFITVVDGANGELFADYSRNSRLG